MMVRVQDGTRVYKVFMVKAAEVMWLLDPFLPYLFPWTLSRILAIFRQEKKGWLCIGRVRLE
jgi:hypothetical protein